MAQNSPTVLDRAAEQLFEGDVLDTSSRGDSDPETQLWRAVLYQIIGDALCVSPYHGKLGSGVSESGRDEARRWCLSVQDRADRMEVLSLADTEPEAFDHFVRAKILPLVEAERAKPQRRETEREKYLRLRLAAHVALGGTTRGAGAGKKPKTAQQWLTVALATGDDAALARAAEMELAEAAA